MVDGDVEQRAGLEDRGQPCGRMSLQPVEELFGAERCGVRRPT